MLQAVQYQPLDLLVQRAEGRRDRCRAATCGGRAFGAGRKQGRLCFSYIVGDGPTFMGTLMNWIVLFVAGLLEVVWAVGLKYTEGFTRLWPSIGTGAAFLLSIGLLSWAMRDLPVGTAYAVWVGIGAIGTAAVGMVLLDEPMTVARVASLGLVAAGIMGLKLSSGG